MLQEFKREAGLISVCPGVCGEVGVGREKGMPKWRSKSYTYTIQEKRVCRSIPGWRQHMQYAKGWRPGREDYLQIIEST